MRVVALGRTRMLWETIQRLTEAGHEVPLIITCRAAPEYDIKEDDFRLLANELGAEFIQTQNINAEESLAALRKTGAEAAVSVNWISLVGEAACAAFRHGVLNAHAGDLPRYRGNAPVAWAILRGENQVGITIHQMDPHELDAGPILVKDYFALGPGTYVGEVMRFLDEAVPRLFLQAVNGLADGSLVPRAQPTDPGLSLRCFPRKPEDGLLDFSWPVQSLDRLVRASSEPFAGAYCYFDDSKVTVWRARAEPWGYPVLAIPGQVVGRDSVTGEVAVAASDGMLVLGEVETTPGGRMKPAELIRSIRDRLGSAPTSSAALIR